MTNDFAPGGPLDPERLRLLCRKRSDDTWTDWRRAIKEAAVAASMTLTARNLPHAVVYGDANHMEWAGRGYAHVPAYVAWKDFSALAAVDLNLYASRPSRGFRERPLVCELHYCRRRAFQGRFAEAAQVLGFPKKHNVLWDSRPKKLLCMADQMAEWAVWIASGKPWPFAATPEAKAAIEFWKKLFGRLDDDDLLHALK